MTDSFPDNWTYLRTELNWLDRVLAGAIARQRKDTKDVERVSKARIDQVTSHWWKGIIQIEGTAAADSPADFPRRSQTKLSFQQQLEARIEASHQQGIVLGLPSLCQQLGLTPFEKNAILLALAPEVSRRYGRIYNFLQETDHPGASGLPTVDLILRLMCRNDSEWRAARLAFSHHAKLLHYGIIVLPPAATEPFLSHPVKLDSAIAEYLLAEIPQLDTLGQLLQSSQHHTWLERDPDNLSSPWPPEPMLEPAPVSLFTSIASLPPPSHDLWETLVLPKEILTHLRHLSDRVRYAEAVEQPWEWQSRPQTCGTVAVLAGAAGTGKTLAAQAIAQSLEVPLACIDLALVEPEQSAALVQQLTAQSPPVLLVKSAQVWLGRSPSLSAPRLRQWLQQRRGQPTLTLLSVEQASFVRSAWQSWLDITLKLPFPNKNSRLRLWKQAFPTTIPLAKDIAWQELAQLPLTGGMIQAIARDAIIYATAESLDLQAGQLSMNHIQLACQFRDIKL